MIFFLDTHYKNDKFYRYKACEKAYLAYIKKVRLHAPKSLSTILKTPYFFHDVYFLQFDYNKARRCLVVDALLFDFEDDMYRRAQLHFTGFADSYSFYPEFTDKYYFWIGGGYNHSGEFHYNDFLKKYEFYFDNSLTSGLINHAKKGVYYQEYKLVFSDIKIISEEVISYDTLKQMLKKRKQKYYSIFED